MSIAVYSLTSPLHDVQMVEKMTKEFLSTLNLDVDIKGDDFHDYGCHDLNLIEVRTGGTEGIFKRLLPQLSKASRQPFLLLASGKSNSLAASMEILSFLRQNGMTGEILHGSPDMLRERIRRLEIIGRARAKLEGTRLGVIGDPSDWLIASLVNDDFVSERMGLQLVKVPMEELIDTIRKTDQPQTSMYSSKAEVVTALPDALRIYEALRVVIDNHQLNGFTIRCFDLLSAIHNTGCLALAKLNAEGIVAGCEGDVPAMISMVMAHALTGCTGFQANPAWMNPDTGEMMFAHCTIPLNMVRKMELMTHFESGIGVGIRGEVEEGPVTIFKMAGGLSRCFIAEGKLVRNEAKPNLCRTQLVIGVDDQSAFDYFLNNPIGNHHIIIPGHHRKWLEDLSAHYVTHHQ